MRECGYFPAGAEYNPRAPWNQKDPKTKTIEVDVSLTISKTLEIEVEDREDLTEWDLAEAVIHQHDIIDKVGDWSRDDFNVMEVIE